MSNLGVRAKLILGAALCVGLPALATAVFLPTHLDRVARRATEEKLESLSRTVAGKVADGVEFRDLPTIDEVIRGLFTLSEITVVEVYNDLNELVERQGSGSLSFLPLGWRNANSVGTYRSSGLMVCVTPLLVEGRRVGCMAVGGSTHFSNDLAQQGRRLVLAIVGLSMLGGTLLAFWVVTRFSRPILELEDAVRPIVRGDFSARVRERGRDEIGSLCQAVNWMLRELQRTRHARDELQREVQDRIKAYDHIMQLKEDAEEAVRVKSEFLANMSHEIRTPMNAILGMTELALETELTREQREYLDMVKVSGESLLGIINEILDFSKMEAGKLSLTLAPFELRQHLSDIVHAQGVRAQRKGLELICDVRPGVPDNLEADPVRLQQVLVNLIGNAVKFTPEGEILVRVELETQTKHGVRLHFSVKDTGVGIPFERQRTIFDAFSQADGTSTRPFEGTGLGLTICAQLVEIMNGKIWVESAPGEGSTFHFTAEFGLTEQETRSLVTPPARLRQMRVLVVDANATSRKLIAEILDNWHFKASAAATGAKALEKITAAEAAGKPFELLIVDHRLPDMSGIDLIEKLDVTSRAKNDRAYVMMVSAVDLMNTSARGRAAGITTYLTKPVMQSGLLDSILTALGETRELPLADQKLGKKREPKLGKLRILLVEDNQVNQKLAMRILEKRNHVVTLAENGRIAVDLWANKEFDLILMDLQMPEMGGLEATRKIREKEAIRGTYIPIVAMTANAMKGDRQRCLDAGMDGYVAKPVKAENLLKTVAKVLKAVAEGRNADQVGSDEVMDATVRTAADRADRVLG